MNTTSVHESTFEEEKIEVLVDQADNSIVTSSSLMIEDE